MKLLTLFSLAIITFAGLLTANDKENKSDLIMHEWGTFTSEIKYGSDGKLSTGLEKEEEHLPNFVYQFNLNSLGYKGMGTSVHNVTVKMETPVIYFYTKDETPFTVDVHFNGGKISQWYPQKTAGETMDPSKIRIIDFSKLKNKGHIQWKGTILAKGSKEKLSQSSTNHKTWLEPRKTDSNLIKVNNEIEKYLFYRGLGNFNTPFKIHFKDHKMIMENKMDQDIPYVLIYRSDGEGKNPKILWEGSIKKKDSTSYEFNKKNEEKSFTKSTFIQALKKAGLYEKEAKSMLNTWDTSYFKKKGIRIFWILPESLTEKILPLKISPTPLESKRVLVGRINIIK